MRKDAHHSWKGLVEVKSCFESFMLMVLSQSTMFLIVRLCVLREDTVDHASGNDLDKSSLMLVKTEPNFSCDEERGTTGRVAAIGCDKAMPMDDDAGSTEDGSIKAMDLTRKSNGIGEEQQGESADVDVLLENHASNSPSSKEKFVSDSSSPSTMELMFNHPSSINIEEKRDREGRMPGLRHSCSSAFSR